MTIVNTISTELEKLIPSYSSKKYILAVSGGVDSMVLLYCFYKLNLNFEVAHFNFQLRGEESDTDETFLKTICSDHNITINYNTTDTSSFASEQGLSIQEAARDLRYTWFFELLKEKNADFIITGHHADDSIETFFINLLRGSGIKGLCGISNHQHIIRPLLPVSRQEIEEYASLNNILFRNDSSNESLKYKRNFIRKKIIPELNKEKSNSSSSILKSINHLKQVNDYVKRKLAQDIQQITSIKGEDICINTQQPIEDLVLYTALNNYGFNESQVNNIQLHTKVVGKKHYSTSHELLIARNQLLIRPIQDTVSEVFEISTLGEYHKPISIRLSEIERPNSFQTEKNKIFLDADAIQHPLQLRRWQEGDWFIPFGMKGKKKLSDFFIDEKFSQFEKENTWLLVSNGNIVWIVNHRLDNRYRLNKTTRKYLQIVTI